jgi:DNA adenine methylase
MKTPLTYYGGKQTLLKHIIPLIPKDHILYAEPFTGGAAVFFAKEPSNIEVINDTNKALMTFYRVARLQFNKLKRRIAGTSHSRTDYKKAKLIYDNPEFFGEFDLAWAVWMLCASAFNAGFNTSFSYDICRQNTTRKFNNKKALFTQDVLKRLEHAQIEAVDACEIIRTRDSKGSFFYCDPPYFNADMGHYKGYTEGNFVRLLEYLSKIKGRFLLSSYPSDTLAKYTKRHGWHTKALKQTTPATYGGRKPKIEVLTANYPLED